jgi:transposase-like protein
LVSRRWPNGVTCPQCCSRAVYFDSSRNGWECKTRHPKRKFTLKTGTIFEDSPIGLDKWLPAVWMISGAKNGISSHELARALGVTQKTAWFMLHRIRLAMQAEGGGKLGGEVEVDETFIGGKARNMHKSKLRRLALTQDNPMSGKTAVFGLLERTSPERKSRVRTAIVPNTRKSNLRPQIDRHVSAGSTVYSDSLPSYKHLSADATFVHQVIDHAECYAKGNVHTNGMENFWSLLKRSIKGTYVSVEPFHLFRYLDEQAFRFNEREGNDWDRFQESIAGIIGRRVTYKQLIGDETRPESL